METMECSNVLVPMKLSRKDIIFLGSFDVNVKLYEIEAPSLYYGTEGGGIVEFSTCELHKFTENIAKSLDLPTSIIFELIQRDHILVPQIWANYEYLSNNFDKLVV